MANFYRTRQMKHDKYLLHPSNITQKHDKSLPHAPNKTPSGILKLGYQYTHSCIWKLNYRAVWNNLQEHSKIIVHMLNLNPGPEDINFSNLNSVSSFCWLVLLRVNLRINQSTHWSLSLRSSDPSVAYQPNTLIGWDYIVETGKIVIRTITAIWVSDIEEGN